MILNAKNGQISVLEDPDESPDSIEILDLSDGSDDKFLCTNGERGLHSIIPSPKFDENQYLYAFYTKYRKDCLEDAFEGPWNVVTRFTMNPETLMLDFDERTVIWRGPPMDERMHNGGAMAFGNDGKLYITTGDAGIRQNAQPLNNSHGSIIRLNEDGSVPNDNPFTEKYGYTDSHRCSDYGGRVPKDASDDAVCSEVWANGLRNPFRIDMDPNVNDKVKFSFGVVGAQHIESIFYGGDDYKGTNYGWPTYEGVCKPGDIENCPVNSDKGITMPFHWYEHTTYEDGGCVGGMAHVPEGLWPSKYKFLFIDFILLKIYLLEDNRPDRACPNCFPPLPPTRNETFYRSSRKEGENVNEARMTEMWFGPYKDTQALYVTKFGNRDTIVRIRYNGILNKPPKPAFDYVYNGVNVEFDASRTIDPENDDLTYDWDFGDDIKSMGMIKSHEYTMPGEYKVTLIVTDPDDQAQQISKMIQIGQPPNVNIITPIENATFSVGQILRLQGEAYDYLGNPIPEDQLTWEVRQHHAQHFHPFLDITEGNNFDLYPAPEPEDYLAATNSFLKIILTATDEYGLSNSYFVDVQPHLVMVNVTTIPSGLDIVLDDYDIETPELVTSWDGFNLPVRVNDQPPYFFRSWSDGAKDRTRTIPIVYNNNTDTKIKAIFCTDSGTGCETSEDCCSGYCNELNNKCAAMPIIITQSPTMKPIIITQSPTIKPSLSPSNIPTSSPTMKPSLTPSNVPTISSTINPTVKPVSSFPSSSPTTTYLRPTIREPDLEIEINVETPPMTRPPPPPPPPLEIDVENPFESFDKNIESVSITIELNDQTKIDNNEGGLDSNMVWLLSLSIILVLLVIGCCYMRLVIQTKDKNCVDSVVESVHEKGYSDDKSEEKNSSKTGSDEYFYQPESDIKITRTTSTEESQNEHDVNICPVSSSYDAADCDMSLSFLIPESIPSEPLYDDDVENPAQVANVTEPVQSYLKSPLSPVTKRDSNRNDYTELFDGNLTPLPFSGTPTMPSLDQYQMNEILEYRFDAASTSQSSLVPPPLRTSDQNSFDGIVAQRSNSTSFCLSIPSPDSVKQDKNCTVDTFDEPSNISEPSFSFLISHASVSEENFLEEERDLENPSDAAETLIQNNLCENSLPLPMDSSDKISTSITKELESASVVNDKLDEVAREFSLLLVDSSDIEDEVIKNNSFGGEEDMNLSINTKQSILERQGEATEAKRKVIKQNQSEEIIVESSASSQDACFTVADEIEYDSKMNRNSIQHGMEANPNESQQDRGPDNTHLSGMAGRNSEADLLSIQLKDKNLIGITQDQPDENLLSVNTYSSNKIEVSTFKSNGVTHNGDDGYDEKEVESDDDDKALISLLASPHQKGMHDVTQPEFLSPELRPEAKPEKYTPETQLLSYDVDSSLDSLFDYISEPQTPPNFQSKSATNLRSSFNASVMNTSNILLEN